MNSCAFSPLQESCLDPAVLHERMQQLMPQHLVKTQSAVAETREMVNKAPCVLKKEVEREKMFMILHAYVYIYLNIQFNQYFFNIYICMIYGSNEEGTKISNCVSSKNWIVFQCSKFFWWDVPVILRHLLVSNWGRTKYKVTSPQRGGETTIECIQIETPFSEPWTSLQHSICNSSFQFWHLKNLGLCAVCSK